MQKKQITKIPREDAEKQVDLFLNFYDIDSEEDASNKAHRESLDASIKKLVKHVMRGRVEITDNGDGGINVLQRLKFPVNDVNELEYKVVGGVAKKQMKNADESDQHGKIYSLVGSLTGWNGNSIAKLQGVDISAVECLGVLFLVV